MKDKTWYLLAGALSGVVLWASVSSLFQNNGLVAIMGLALSCLVMGFGLGMTIGCKND
jgi:hypothetical protein